MGAPASCSGVVIVDKTGCLPRMPCARRRQTLADFVVCPPMQCAFVGLVYFADVGRPGGLRWFGRHLCGRYVGRRMRSKLAPRAVGCHQQSLLVAILWSGVGAESNHENNIQTFFFGKGTAMYPSFIPLSRWYQNRLLSRFSASRGSCSTSEPHPSAPEKA